MLTISDRMDQSFIKLLLRYLFTLLAIFLIITFLYLWLERQSHLNEYKKLARARLDYQGQVILNHFEAIRSDLIFLPQLNEMIRYKEMNREKDRIDIEKEFLEFSRSRKVYDQIRYLDNRGMELCRINYNDGLPRAVPREGLQFKGDRYYFEETIKLSDHEVYISPFDLNMEHDKIEFPLKPMMRLGTPIHTVSGEQNGILILNFLGSTILSDLENATALQAGTFSLLNTNGYWLYNNEPDDEWGFMYPEKQDISFANRYPDLWPVISQSSNFQKLTKEFLVTSQFIIPLPEVRRSQKESYFILLSTITHEEMGTEMRTLLNSLFKILLYFSPVMIFISFFLAGVTTQRNRYRQDLKLSALYDQLTKLPNRTLFKEQAEAQLDLSKRYARMMALLFIDLDGFKKVNDTLGHEAGDILLKAVADRLKSCIRKTDMAARIGGDEFIILLSEISSSEDCRIISEKVLASISKEFTLKGSSVSIGASIGVAIYTAEKNETLDDLTRRADKAMYEVKKSGKHSYRISRI